MHGEAAVFSSVSRLLSFDTNMLAASFFCKSSAILSHSKNRWATCPIRGTAAVDAQVSRISFDPHAALPIRLGALRGISVSSLVMIGPGVEFSDCRRPTI
jgi:hypothetical protein